MAAVVALVLSACGNGDDPAVSGSAPDNSADMADDHGDMSATCSPSGSGVSLVASETSFDKDCLAVPGGQAFTLTLENKDGFPHSIAILESHQSADVLFRSDLFAGPKTMTFDVDALEAGTYAFHCEVHPSQMQGTFVVA